MTRICMACAIILCIAVSARSQKIGHVNYRMLIDSLDESKKINEQLNRYEMSLFTVGSRMDSTFRVHLKKYQDAAASGTLTGQQRTQMESDLETEQTALNNYQQSAKESFQKRQAELMQPFLKKVQIAISDFGTKQGYQALLDSAGLIIFPDSEDLFVRLLAVLTTK
mgnify:CR=1 FL=1